ncbi:diketogulonate reductase-like aldo/keto reductase [Hymenobacter luteus]|uniref:Diketogulonate reductase-like aldo/keto reductase n=2 Tax=Hymenobacter TaxID=89966 RepID=A0A7W9WEL4_9BACT|nr:MULTISPECIES: aldo/keto reductase [Hymenobacter]MBB4602925.1 diketogulonate reductase-like aldo/keto reductase [Hymenobacter latericoloratus]MBB6060817.1 diketogulonate reductase-like aldo/keto reductase [Hymenobacter luteus]
MLTRPIPSSQEPLPVVGLGTWQTFDVRGVAGQPPLRQTLETLRAAGGSVIDSSPMYGRAEEVVGELTSALPAQQEFFYATKVWTQGREAGIRQMEDSLHKLRRPTLDLLQIHNLVDWKTHLATLRDWQAAGRVRYLGITHYTDAMHPELERVLRLEKLDFVQFNYSILDRHAEQRLLPAAAELGVATLINRPFTEGSLLARLRGKALPPWATELGISSWPQFLLRFILSHPAVTCVIPGTSNPTHLQDNLRAAKGPLPDEATREKMAAYVRGL